MTATRESLALGTQAAPARTEPARGVDLSIVIPAFNEEHRLPASLGAVSAYLAARPSAPRVEVLVVDDGSSDATASRAEDAGRRHGLDLRVLRLPRNRGKGFAVRTGCLEAAGRLVLVSDADFSTPIYEWEKLASANAPVAIGSRAVDESLVKEHQSLGRVAMGKLFNRLVRLLLVPGIHDTQCGFKLFSRDAAREIFSRATVDRFAYDVEALLLARELGYAIAEVPVLWFNSPDSRVTLYGGAQAYLELFRLRMRQRARGPETAGRKPSRAETPPSAPGPSP
ncbi:MAG TPA: dolichyl-phosphate beta-glucosyltransferase [Thermoanaerobaculia bacterium]|nr:dolichyl-phosphate beta-glucosyltransferase [Thermoanaerobaculia bacterium]